MIPVLLRVCCCALGAVLFTNVLVVMIDIWRVLNLRGGGGGTTAGEEKVGVRGWEHLNVKPGKKRKTHLKLAFNSNSPTL